MGEWVVFLGSALAVILLAVLVRVTAWLSRRSYSSWEVDLEELKIVLEIPRVAGRWLFGQRIARFRGAIEEGEYELEVELGAGETSRYTRLELRYASSLDLGVVVQTKRDDNIWARVTRMREVEIGHAGFDPHFLLLCREPARLEALLEPTMRRMLLDLRKEVWGIHAGDEGVYLHMVGVLGPEELAPFVADALRLANRMRHRAQTILENEMQQVVQSTHTNVFTPAPGDLNAINFDAR